MTRKDFEAIAHVLDANVAPFAIVSDFADMLGNTNPLFNRARFVTAATLHRREATDRETRMIDRAAGRV